MCLVVGVRLSRTAEGLAQVIELDTLAFEFLEPGLLLSAEFASSEAIPVTETYRTWLVVLTVSSTNLMPDADIGFDSGRKGSGMLTVFFVACNSPFLRSFSSMV